MIDPMIPEEEKSYSIGYDDQPLIFIFFIMQYTYIDIFADIEIEGCTRRKSIQVRSVNLYEEHSKSYAKIRRKY
jgi:hypothetical protein